MSSSPSTPPAGGNDDIGYKLVAVAIATISVASVIVAIRFYVRIKIVRAVGWDDWLMLLSLVLGIVAAATEIQAVSLGLGRHAYYLNVDQKIGAGEYEAISSAFSIMSLCFGKISICISLLRILQGASWRKLKLTLYVTIIVVSIVNSVVTIMTLVQCRPITKIWNPSIPGSCLDIDVQKDLAYLQGAVSAFADFELSLLPILVFQSLQMNKRSKLILSSLMGIGFLTGITAITRIVYIEPYARLADMTYTSINLQIWAALERNVAIIVASIPCLHPLLRLLRGSKSLGSTRYQPHRKYPFTSNQSHELSVGSGTVNKQRFMPCEASAARNDSATSILPEHHSSRVWKTTQITSTSNAVYYGA